MTDAIVLVAEGKNDQLATEALLKRLCANITTELVTWADVKRDAPPFRSDFASSLDAKLKGEALQAYKAARWKQATGKRVVLLRDTDNRHDRLALQTAMKEALQDDTVVVGVAHPKIEAWLLVAYQPRNDDEKGKLKKQQELLNFDPCTQPNHLNDKQGGPRDAKTVVAALGGHHRCAEDLECAEWHTITERDGKNDGGGQVHSRFGVMNFHDALRASLHS
jgi:hypothetical protein